MALQHKQEHIMNKATSIRYIKFNWSKVYHIVKSEMIKAVTFKDPKDNGYAYHFKHEMLETDTFWPFGSDGSLSRALRHTLVPNVNYRSCLSVRAQKDAIDEIRISIEEIFYEMQDNITEYYSNAWNFPPGYTQPEGIEFDEDVMERIYKRIRREAKTGEEVIKY